MMAGCNLVCLGSIPSTASSDVATKGYVDVLVNGLKWKAAVRVAATSNTTLASIVAGSVLDGVTLVSGNRFLLKGQTDAKENGIYTVLTGIAPVRSADADTGSELVSAAVFVFEGTVNHDTAWVCTNDTVTIGVTNIVFVTFASTLGTLLAGNNLSDLTSASTARTNLGLGTLATQNGTFSGTHSGTSSGTNTGDQTITLTGDVTGSGTGSFASAIAANSVTLHKFQQIATASLLGRSTAATGDVEVITVGSGLSLSGGTLAVTGGGGGVTDGFSYSHKFLAQSTTAYSSQYTSSALGGGAWGSGFDKGATAGGALKGSTSAAASSVVGLSTSDQGANLGTGTWTHWAYVAISRLPTSDEEFASGIWTWFTGGHYFTIDTSNNRFKCISTGGSSAVDSGVTVIPSNGSDANFYLLKIVVVGTTSAKFYINGSLVATITTSLPTCLAHHLVVQHNNKSVATATNIWCSWFRLDWTP